MKCVCLCVRTCVRACTHACVFVPHMHDVPIPLKNITELGRGTLKKCQ